MKIKTFKQMIESEVPVNNTTNNLVPNTVVVSKKHKYKIMKRNEAQLKNNMK
jgi:DNA-directed RNA polymerase subunit H (RpoH/RPB5)